jgi:hypothetical protein
MTTCSTECSIPAPLLSRIRDQGRGLLGPVKFVKYKKFCGEVVIHMR